MLEIFEECLFDGCVFFLGDWVIEVDIRFFVILIWFDVVYYGFFKINC